MWTFDYLLLTSSGWSNQVEPNRLKMPLALFRWAYHAHLAVPLDQALFVRHNGREGYLSCAVQDGFRLFSYDGKYEWLKESDEVVRFQFTDDQTKDAIPFRYLYHTVESKEKGFPAGFKDPIKFTVVNLLTEVDNLECLKEKNEEASQLRTWAKEVLTLFVEWYRLLNNDPSVHLPQVEESPVVEIWAGEKPDSGGIAGAELAPFSRHLNWRNPVKAGISKRNLSKDGIQMLAEALQSGYELTLYKRLLLEARELAHVSHNYALSIVVAGTAFEVLVAQELKSACERRQITQLQVGPKSAPRMKDYRKAIQDGRLNIELLAAFPKAICGLSLKTLPGYQVWFRDAYEPRNSIIHGGTRKADELAARGAFEAVSAFGEAICSTLTKDQRKTLNESAELKDSDRPAMIYVAHRFREQVINLDGNVYRNCQFDICSLIYNGGRLPVLAGNSFNNCSFRFENAVERTIKFMTALYHGGFRDMIEKSLENIRGNPRN